MVQSSHPVNRFCHTLGIPTILLSIPFLLPASSFTGCGCTVSLCFSSDGSSSLLPCVRGQAAEFFHDWRFLFVGVRWWWAKIHGKA